MKSLFDPNVNKEMIERIQQLKPDSKAEWGKMSVSQMVTHAQFPFKVAFEEMKLKRGIIGILFGGLAKKKLGGSAPFQKNLPTDKNFIVKNEPDFETEVNKLKNLVEDFSKKGPSALTKQPHPFFGKLTSEEWDNLMYKHLDHHLRQFGT
jgi:hypothetical protein